MNIPNFDKAGTAISSVTNYANRKYRKYWDTIACKTDDDLYDRLLFCLGSVHSNVKANLNFYEYVKKLPRRVHEHYSVARLTYLLKVGSKSGLYAVRGRALWNLSKDFWTDPKQYWKREDESFCGYRDRISSRVLMLGVAKTAFLAELVYPNESDVVCLDRHMLRLYDVPFDCSKQVYKECENHWIEETRNRNLNPVYSRHRWWDSIRTPRQTDCRYWAYVFEDHGQLKLTESGA